MINLPAPNTSTLIQAGYNAGGTFESIIPRTIVELESLKPRFLIPCHCSGLKAVNEIARNKTVWELPINSEDTRSEGLSNLIFMK